MKKLKVDLHKKFLASVDAGNIGIADVAYLEENGAITKDKGQETTLKRLGLLLDVEPGMYRFFLSAKNTWKGDVAVNGVITTHGRLYVGDICYPFSCNVVADSVWSKFLKKTNYLEEKINEKMSILSTGGDGGFTTSLDLIKVSAVQLTPEETKRKEEMFSDVTKAMDSVKIKG